MSDIQQPSWVGFDPTKPDNWLKQSYARFRIGAVVAWAVLLTSWNWVVTQYVAHRFEYHEALGAPLFGAYYEWGLYQPFAFEAWWLELYFLPWTQGNAWTSEVDAVWTSGSLLLSLGAIVCMGGVALMGLRKPQKRYLPVHGTAHWCTEQEIRDDADKVTLLAPPRKVPKGRYPNDVHPKTGKNHDGISRPEDDYLFVPKNSGTLFIQRLRHTVIFKLTGKPPVY